MRPHWAKMLAALPGWEPSSIVVAASPGNGHDAPLDEPEPLLEAPLEPPLEPVEAPLEPPLDAPLEPVEAPLEPPLDAPLEPPPLDGAPLDPPLPEPLLDELLDPVELAEVDAPTSAAPPSAWRVENATPPHAQVVASAATANRLVCIKHLQAQRHRRYHPAAATMSPDRVTCTQAG
jgi:hypothetical protein